MAEVRGEPVTREDLADMIGEGVHTGLRKGADHPDASKVHAAITDMDDEAWHDALMYCADGLRYMGYELVKVAK